MRLKVAFAQPLCYMVPLLGLGPIVFIIIDYNHYIYFKSASTLFSSVLLKKSLARDRYRT